MSHGRAEPERCAGPMSNSAPPGDRFVPRRLPRALKATPDAPALFRALVRRWPFAAGVGGALAGLAALAAWFLLAPKPVAYAQVHIAATPPRLLPGYAQTDPAESRHEFLTYQRTQAARIKSRYVLSAALKRDEVQRLSLVRGQADPLAWLEEEVRVEYPEGSEILTLSLAGTPREDLLIVVNAVSQAYWQEVVKAERKQLGDRVAKLDGLHVGAKEQLRRLRDELRRRSAEAGGSDSQVLTQKQQILLRTYDDLRQQHSQVRFGLLRKEGQLAAHLAHAEALSALTDTAAEPDALLDVDLMLRALSPASRQALNERQTLLWAQLSELKKQHVHVKRELASKREELQRYRDREPALEQDVVTDATLGDWLEADPEVHDLLSAASQAALSRKQSQLVATFTEARKRHDASRAKRLEKQALVSAQQAREQAVRGFGFTEDELTQAIDADDRVKEGAARVSRLQAQITRYLSAGARDDEPSLVRLRSDLRAAESDLDRIRTELRTGRADRERRKHETEIAATVAHSQAELSAATDEETIAAGEVKRLAQELRGELADWLRRKVRADFEATLRRLQNETASLTKQEADLAAEVEQLGQDLRDELGEWLRRTAQADFDAVTTQFRDEVSVLTKHEGVLAGELQGLARDADKIGSSSTEMDLLRADIRHEEEFLAYVGKKLDALQAELDSPPRVTLHQEAALQRPNLKRQIVATAMAPLAVLVGVGYLVGRREFSARRIHSAEDVALGLDLPVLGIIPEVSGSGMAEDRLRGAVDALRARLLRNPETQAARTLLVTSPAGGEGKTTLAMHLAASLARSGSKTLLIDADLRHPAIHDRLSLSVKPGLADLLRDETTPGEAQRTVDVHGLHVLPAGAVDDSTREALTNTRLGTLFARLRAEHEFIILDAPSVLPSSDTLWLGQHADAVIFTVVRGTSRAPEVYAACHRLGEMGIPVAGAVLRGEGSAD